MLLKCVDAWLKFILPINKIHLVVCAHLWKKVHILLKTNLTESDFSWNGSNSTVIFFAGLKFITFNCLAIALITPADREFLPLNVIDIFHEKKN